MTSQPWWELHPNWLQEELTALSEAGIDWQIDEDERAHGVLRLHLIMKVEGEQLPLDVVLPDLYPYFRCEVVAPTLTLPLHQNPFGRNLCLLPRRTHFWNPNDTVAALLQQQLPKVLKAARANDRDSVEGMEQHQGEPFSDYYGYHLPAIAIIESDWSLPLEHRHGRLIIGTNTPAKERPDMFLRGAVLQVQDANGEVLLSTDRGMRSAFPGQQITGLWARLPEPIPEGNPLKFMQRLLQERAELRQAPANHVSEGWLRVWGFVFPEEVAYKTTGDGWVFVCAFDKKRPQVPSPHRRPPNSAASRNDRRSRRSKTKR